MTPSPTPAIRTRSAMVDVRGAAAVRGVHVRVIESLVNGGTLLGRFDPHERGFQWVWNFAVNAAGKERYLRFWTREVGMPETTAGLTWPQVRATLVPPGRRAFAIGEICTAFVLTYDHLRDLKRVGALPPNDFTPAAALENFLTERLLNK